MGRELGTGKVGKNGRVAAYLNYVLGSYVMKAKAHSLIAAFLLVSGCQLESGADSSDMRKGNGQERGEEREVAVSKAPFTIQGRVGTKVLNNGNVVKVTFVEITSTAEGLLVEEVKVNDGNCQVTAQNFFFTPVQLDDGQKAVLQVFQIDSLSGNVVVCDINKALFGTNQGWYLLQNTRGSYVISEVEIPFERMEFQTPDYAVFVKDSSGKNRCIEWECLVKLGERIEIDNTTVDYVTTWTDRPLPSNDEFKEIAGNQFLSDERYIKVVQFESTGDVYCSNFWQEKDEETWEISNFRDVTQGKFEVKPGLIKLEGDSLARCITGDRHQKTGRAILNTEDRAKYQHSDGRIYLSGKTKKWCRSRLNLVFEGREYSTQEFCQVSGFFSDAINRMMDLTEPDQGAHPEQ